MPWTKLTDVKNRTVAQVEARWRLESRAVGPSRCRSYGDTKDLWAPDGHIRGLWELLRDHVRGTEFQKGIKETTERWTLRWPVLRSHLSPKWESHQWQQTSLNQTNNHWTTSFQHRKQYNLKMIEWYDKCNSRATWLSSCSQAPFSQVNPRFRCGEPPLDQAVSYKALWISYRWLDLTARRLLLEDQTLREQGVLRLDFTS